LPAPNVDACRQGTPIGGTLPACRFCRADVAPGTSGDVQPAADPAWLRHLYLCRECSTYEIAGRTGLDRQRVTRMLRKAGVPLPPRGAGRRRALRRAEDPPDLPRLVRDLYEGAKLSSGQVSAVLGVPERTVRERLRRYGITTRTRGGWNREDRKTLVKDLYWACGTGTNHIELITGQAAESVRKFMRRAGIALRPPGGRTPFLRRWRTGLAGGPAHRPPGRRHQGPFQDASRAERAAPTKEEMRNDDIGCS
jgi:hypothetical protein